MANIQYYSICANTLQSGLSWGIYFMFQLFRSNHSLIYGNCTNLLVFDPKPIFCRNPQPYLSSKASEGQHRWQSPGLHLEVLCSRCRIINFPKGPLVYKIKHKFLWSHLNHMHFLSHIVSVSVKNWQVTALPSRCTPWDQGTLPYWHYHLNPLYSLDHFIDLTLLPPVPPLGQKLYFHLL